MRKSLARVLIVDDAIEVRQLLRRLVEKAGMEPVLAQDGRTALAMIRQHCPDVVLLDVRIPGLDGREVLQQALALDAALPIVMMTAFGSIPDAVQLVRAGARDYLTKPFSNDQVIQAISRALGDITAQRSSETDEPPLEPTTLHSLMGPSAKIEALSQEVARVAPTDFSVLILGETGVGKELVAEAIHAQSRRSGARFVALDCGAIPEALIESELFGYERGAFTGADRTRVGKFELAEGGTLFLDEISNLSLAMQNKLLRVLQERRFYRVGGSSPITSDVRILAASNQSLNGGATPFRIDLFHRLSEYIINVPPLRERKEDITYLADRFIRVTNQELEKGVRGLSPAALEALRAFDWEGNVRELRNVIRRGVLWATDIIDLEQLGPMHLPVAVGGGERSQLESEGREGGECSSVGNRSLKEIARQARAAAEQQAILELLTRTGGNIAEVARLLGADYKTIHSKIKEYGIRGKLQVSSTFL